MTGAHTTGTATGATGTLPYDPAGLHVEEAGDAGPRVLCLHGIGSSSVSFTAQLAELGAHARVFAWDAPGYGRSADPGRPLTLDDYADTAAALLRERGGPAHVVGASWGGVIALRLALRHPGLVLSLVLADSSPGSGTDPHKARAMRARADELAESGPRAFAARRAPRLLGQDAPAGLAERVVSSMAAAVRLPGYRYAAESMAATDHSDRLASVTAPALVLVGEHDRVTGVAGAQALAGALPRCAFVVVRGAGHLAHQEQPARVNAWILSHLDICSVRDRG
ncbi:alpha/beta fold hydrolase [Streptomyces sp. DW26H14]|uniref:alpha/beta fold hydrolase n=1 Tax=Streptomyces sp. DW26H14 TaxID=3435395 RepID=UPI00403E1053